ncbi:MAG: RNA-guided endonuclease InsQ/TnpB family protein [Candidatus Hodarchaeales archaeon]
MRIKDPHVRKTLREWVGTARYVYNRGLEAIQKGGHSGNFYQLRNQFVSWKVTDKTTGKKGTNPEIKKWEIETPKNIRAEALHDLSKNLINNKKRTKEGKISHFKLKYRSKKKASSIGINKDSLKIEGSKIYLFQRILKTPLMSGKRTIKKWFSDRQLEKIWDYKTDVRLYYDGVNFFLHFPIYKEAHNPISVKKRSDLISLDPGLRTFQTGYSEGEVIKCHVKDPELVKRLKVRLDNLRSLRAKGKISKGRYKKSYYLKSNKLKNMVDDLHWQTCNYLTGGYYKILLPHFDSQEMKANSGVPRSVTKRRNRNFDTYKHYKFKERLVSKCLERGCHIYLVNESYTSKTCGHCGNIGKIGLERYFRCNKCGNGFDRDINGARNILIRNIRAKVKLKIRV